MSPNLLSVLREIVVLGPWAATHYLPSLCPPPLSELYKIYLSGYLISNFIFSHSFFFLGKIRQFNHFLLPPTSIFTMSLTIFNSAVYLICFIYSSLHLRSLYPWSGCVFLRAWHEQNIIVLGIRLREEPTGWTSPTLQQDSGALRNASVCKSCGSGLTWVLLK